MSQTFLLIDYENVRDLALASIPDKYHVLIFVGKSQNTIPFAMASEAQRLGSRLEWVKIEGDGRNNLDFHLTFYLGQLSDKHPDAEFVVLSKDKGFDAVLKHATAHGHRCSRSESLARAGNASSPVDDPHFEKAFKVLSGIEKKSRPRKRSTLITHLAASVFQKKEPTQEVERIVNALFDKKRVSEANNALTYHF